MILSSKSPPFRILPRESPELGDPLILELELADNLLELDLAPNLLELDLANNRLELGTK